MARHFQFDLDRLIDLSVYALGWVIDMTEFLIDRSVGLCIWMWGMTELRRDRRDRSVGLCI
jgi:hypothetical protein